MQFKHAPAAVSAVFDDPNLVSAAGLVPMLRLARSAGLDELARERLSVPTDKGANAGAKVMALVAGMLAGADSIDDMNLLRHGGMGRLFDRTYAPSTLGSFLREFRFGHVRQLDAVASRVFANLAVDAPLLRAGDGERVMVDLDDTIIEVHGYQKQGAGFGYSGVRGLNALLATASTTSSAPVILAQRLRQGKTGSPKGAARIVGDALATLRRTRAGPFTLAEAISLDFLEECAKGGSLDGALLPLQAGLDDIPAFPVTPDEARLLRVGQRLSRVPLASGLHVAVDGTIPVALIEGDRIVRGFNLQE